MTAAKAYVYMDVESVWDHTSEMAESRGENRSSVHFRNLFLLAAGGRQMAKATVVAGSFVSEEPRLISALNRLRDSDVLVHSAETHGRDVAANFLSLEMLRDIADAEVPGVAVYVTGDGYGFEDKSAKMRADLERLRARKWRLEVLSWRDCSSPRMLAWVRENGLYTPLENFYDNITYTIGRDAEALDLSKRKTLESILH